MFEINRRRYEMLTRVRDFGTTYGDRFPESSLASRAFAEVNAAIGSIEANDVAETTASVLARGKWKQEARQSLEERLVLIARTAQVLPGADPAFKAQFKVPGWRPGHFLLTAARRYVQAATPAAAQFVAHGMAPSFLSELGTVIERFEEALRGRARSQGHRVAARAAIREALATAFVAVRQLDVMVANHLGSDPA